MKDTDTPIGADGDPDTTNSTRTRWKYAATTLSTLMLVSLATVTVCVAAGFFTLGAITQSWMVLYATVTLMAATWAFGEETLKAVRRARGKDK